MLERGHPGRSEVGLVAFVLAGLALVVYGRHVARGGWLFDDWWVAGDYRRFAGEGGFFGAVADFEETGGRRLLGPVYHSAVQYLVDTPTTQLLWAVGLAAGTALALFVTLRNLGFERAHAIAVAALFLVAPATDSVRLWFTASVSSFALMTFLLGMIASTAGLRESRRGRSLALHGLGLALYLVSILTYEIAAAAVLCSFLLYSVATDAPRYAIAVRSSVDVLAALLVMADTAVNGPRAVRSASSQLEHARNMQGEARVLFETAGVPEGTRLFPTVVVAAMVAIAALALWRRRRREGPDPHLKLWLIRFLFGVGFVGVGYAMFVPADAYYTPLQPGIGNRTNAVATIGLTVALYSFLMLGATLLLSLRPRTKAPQTLLAVGALATSLLGALWVPRVLEDAEKFERAAGMVEAAADTLKAQSAEVRPGMVLYLFGLPAEPYPGIYTLVRHEDTSGMVRLVLGDQTLRGVSGGTLERSWFGNAEQWGLDCLEKTVHPSNWVYGPKFRSSYGETAFVDLERGTMQVIASRRQCIAEATKRGLDDGA